MTEPKLDLVRSTFAVFERGADLVDVCRCSSSPCECKIARLSSHLDHAEALHAAKRL
jgi:hypothetical protein